MQISRFSLIAAALYCLPHANVSVAADGKFADAPFSCTVADARFTSFSDFHVLTTDGSDSVALSFAAERAIVGQFRTFDGDVAMDIAGTVPMTVHAMRSEHLGSILYTSDLTTAFQGAFRDTDTHIVMEVSRPEVPEATFAATLSVWARFADGRRTLLCNNMEDFGCVSVFQPVNCQMD